MHRLRWRPWTAVGPPGPMVARYGAETGINISRCSLGLSPNRDDGGSKPYDRRRTSNASADSPLPTTADGVEAPRTRRRKWDIRSDVRPPLWPPFLSGAPWRTRNQRRQWLTLLRHHPLPRTTWIVRSPPPSLPRQKRLRKGWSCPRRTGGSGRPTSIGR